jgi:hypothetical protein
MCQADKEVLSFKLDAEGGVASLPEAAEPASARRASQEEGWSPHRMW